MQTCVNSIFLNCQHQTSNLWLWQMLSSTCCRKNVQDVVMLGNCWQNHAAAELPFPHRSFQESFNVDQAVCEDCMTTTEVAFHIVSGLGSIKLKIKKKQSGSVDVCTLHCIHATLWVGDPTPAPTPSGISSAGAALAHQLYSYFNTCDLSWSCISRLPSWTSRRSHQDLTRLAAAGAAWILMKTLSVQSMRQLLTDKWKAVMFQAPSSAITAPGIIWAGAALDQRCTTCFKRHVTGLGLGFQDHQVVHQQEIIRIAQELLELVPG